MAELETHSSVRHLTILAQDPQVKLRRTILTTRVAIPGELLREGPTGHRVQVIDYDSSTDRLLAPKPVADGDAFAKNDPAELVKNPHFHAQNVYAIVMATLALFERALGRRVRWGFLGHQIKVVPHAFADANAYYSRDDEALMFGYFTGKRGTVFTCLSHDIVAHETAHALLDGLRRNYLLPSSPQQAAFHEGFADIVAILSVLNHRDVVDAVFQHAGRKQNAGAGLIMKRSELTATRLRRTALLGLAEEMGSELKAIRGEALRRSAELPPSRRYLETLTDEHDLGEVLVAAVLNTFLHVWMKRLFPYDTAGVASLDRAHVVDEGATAAGHLLTMMIRSLDYCPPVDLHFGDFLSAVLTADTEMHPDDSRYGYRDVLIKVCGEYGISPAANAWGSKSGRWLPPEHAMDYGGVSYDELRWDPEAAFRFIWQNLERLRLEPNAYTYVESVRPTVRTNGSGFVTRETVVEYVQILDIEAGELKEYGLEKPAGMRDWQRVRLNGGAALIFDDRGKLKLHVGSGVTSKKQNARLAHLFESGHFDDRGSTEANLAHVHRMRAGAPNLRDPYLEVREDAAKSKKTK